jgi:hypothetical protein
MTLITSLIVFTAVLIAVLAHNWLNPRRSTGLSLAYLVILAMNHWLGALIHALNWYNGKEDTSYVALGFEECSWGVVAFGFGCMVVAPLALMLFSRRLSPNARLAPEGQSTIFIWIGILFYTILGRLLGRIPSFSAVAACGVYLVIVGMCLKCWEAWQRHNLRRFLFILMFIPALPLLTMVNAGFLGYGTAAAIMVLCFVFRIFRPRWLAVTAMLLVFYLGPSVFITYFRDRSEIRAAVWGGEGYGARFGQLLETFENFEFFDPHNDAHLTMIDSRLNQNLLVGMAVSRLNSGVVPYANGATLWQAIVALIPRIIWPGKPWSGGSGGIVSKYTGVTFGRGTSVGVGSVMELYINFGRWGIVVGFLLIGAVIGFFDGMAVRRLYDGNAAGFATWFLPGLGFLQAGGSFVEVTSTVAASVVLMWVMNHYILPELLRRKRSQPPRNPALLRRPVFNARPVGRRLQQRGYRL